MSKKVQIPSSKGGDKSKPWVQIDVDDDFQEPSEKDPSSVHVKVKKLRGNKTGSKPQIEIMDTKAGLPATILVFVDGKFMIRGIDYDVSDTDEITWLRFDFNPMMELCVVDASDGSTFWTWSAIEGDLTAPPNHIHTNKIADDAGGT